MDGREELINLISRDILKSSEDFEEVKKKVKEYSNICEDVIRNFYEIESMSNEVPLFKFCYYLNNGFEDLGIEEKEFNEEIKLLEDKIFELFKIRIENNSLICHK